MPDPTPIPTAYPELIGIDMKENLSAQTVLENLKAGNERYMANLASTKPLTVAPPELVEEQKPSAIILGCSDARVPVELIFDQPLGELFVIRVAGNIIAPSQIGSIEFAAEKFGTRLVVVLGHSHCGAVTACVETLINPDQYYSPNLQSIVDRIRPSVYNLHEIMTASDAEVDIDEFVNRAVRANVRMSVSQLKHGSRILEDMVTHGDLTIIGAEYDIATGRVNFLDS